MADAQAQFFQAIANENIPALTALLDGGFDVNTRNAEGFTGLMVAADMDNAAAVTLLIQRGADVNVVSNGRTALMNAALSHSLSVIQPLATAPGINLNYQNEGGQTALHLAVEFDDSEFIEDLLAIPNINININLRDNHGDTPLLMAAQYGDIQSIRVLRLRGADVTIANNDGRTASGVAVNQNVRNVVEAPADQIEQVAEQAEAAQEAAGGFQGQFFTAVRTGNVAQMEALAGAHGVDINARNEDGRSALEMAIGNNDENMVGALIERGANVNARDADDERTPLMLAAELNRSGEILTFLFAENADSDLQDDSGKTALHIAAENDAGEFIEQFLDMGAPVAMNIRDNEGNTALLIASEENFGKVVLSLRAAGADVTIANNAGETAITAAANPEIRAILEAPAAGLNDAYIQWEAAHGEGAAGAAATQRFFDAIEDGDLVLVRQELDAGLDVNVRNENGRTGLMMAAGGGNRNMVVLLLQNGADVNAGAAGDNTTALMYAALVNQTEVIQPLVTAPGANVNAQNNQGRTALHLACQEGMVEFIIELLDFDIPLDVNMRDNDGNTALMLGAREGLGAREIRDLRNAGADVGITNNAGQTAIDLAINDETRNLLQMPFEELDELVEAQIAAEFEEDFPMEAPAPAANVDPLAALRETAGPPPGDEPFEGTFDGDLDIFQSILEDTVNNSLCPICLGHVYRSDGCMYLNHNCRLINGQPSNRVYHQKLYNLYNISGKIFWCGICGRVCGGRESGVTGHQHHYLGPHQSTERTLLHSSGGQFYDVQQGADNLCLAKGGGGFDEKIKRADRLITWSAQLQSQIGQISRRDALYQIIEETWNAPLSRNANLANIKANKKFTVPFNAFPKRPIDASDSKEPEGPGAESTEPEDIPKPADELANVPELVQLPEGETFMDPVTLDDVSEGIRFKHKRRDGTVYTHTDDELISRDGLTSYIRNLDRNDAKFGRCFLDPCDARLWPQDIDPYIADRPAFERYRQDFNIRMQGVQAGGAKRMGITYEIEDVSCTLPPRKKKGGKTYRRKPKNSRSKTYKRRG